MVNITNNTNSARVYTGDNSSIRRTIKKIFNIKTPEHEIVRVAVKEAIKKAGRNDIFKTNGLLIKNSVYPTGFSGDNRLLHDRLDIQDIFTRTPEILQQAINNITGGDHARNDEARSSIEQIFSISLSQTAQTQSVPNPNNRDTTHTTRTDAAVSGNPAVPTNHTQQRQSVSIPVATPLYGSYSVTGNTVVATPIDDTHSLDSTGSVNTIRTDVAVSSSNPRSTSHARRDHSVLRERHNISDTSEF